MKLTDNVVDGLALPPGKADQIIFDSDHKKAVVGFGVRLRANCRPVWVLQYRIGPRHRRYQLGAVAKLPADKARERARELVAEVVLGRDPQAEKIERKAATSHSFAAVVDLYLTARRKAVELGKLRAVTLTEVERYLRKSWKPLHRLDVDTVDRKRVALGLNRIADASGSASAARARSALQSMFVWAMGEGIARQNPVIGTNAPEESAPRDRVLGPDEVREVWRACRDDDYGRAVKLLLLTGCRRAEIGGLKWSEIDREKCAINLPSDRTKNGRPHSIPLAPLALSIIESVPHRAGRDLMFGVGPRGFRGWTLAKVALEDRVRQHRQKMGGLPPMPEWRTHDLRRSVATGMADIGIQPHIIEACLNHQSGSKRGVAGIYNRSTYEKEVKQAFALWADEVRAIVEGGERKVIPIHGAA
jgi:integrase